MSSPLTEKYKAVSQSINETKDKLIEQYRKVKEANDEKGMLQIGANLESIIQKSDKATRAYEQEQAVRKESLLSGISSGELISDKQKPIKSFVQFPDPSGARNYGEEFNYSPLIYNPNKARKAFAELVETDPKKVDVTTGVGLKETTMLAGLQDDEARKAYLQQNYEEVLPINTVGSSNFLVKNKEGNYILALPKGINMKDVGAAVATETLPLAAGIGAGIASVGTGPAAPLVASGASNLAYSGVGAAQDVAFRKMAGLPAGIGKVAAERGKEIGIGLVADLAIPTLAKPFLKRAGTAIENNLAKELREAAQLAESKGMKVRVPVGAEGGMAGLQLERYLGGAFPDMALAKEMEKSREVLFGYQKASQEGVINVPKADIIARVKGEADQLAAMIEKQNVRLKGQAKGWVDNRLKQIMPDKTNQVEAGKNISQILTNGQEVVKKAKNTAFDDFANEVDSAGILQTPEELAALLRPIVQDSRGGVNPVVNDVYTRLANAPRDLQEAAILRSKINQVDAAGQAPNPEDIKRLAYLDEYSQPFDARTSRDLIRKLQAQLPESSVGADASVKIARDATQAVRDNFENKLANTPLADKWGDFKDAYTDFLSYEKGQIGKMVTDNFGDLKIAPEEIIQKSLVDTKAVTDVLNAVKASGDTQGEAYLRKTLQDAYLEKIGMTSGYKGTKSNYKPEMIEALWGNPLAAKRVNSQISELNDILAKNKIEGVDIPASDVNRLLDIIPINERKKLIDDIVKKGKIQDRLDRLMSNEVVKQAKRGNWTYLDDTVTNDVLLNKASTSDVLDIFKRLPLSEQRKRGASMFARMLDNYSTSGTNQTRLGNNLWDAEKVNKEVLKNPQWLRNMKAVDKILGKNDMDEFIAYSKLQVANTPMGKAENLEVRGVTSESGVKWYTSPVKYINNKTLAMAYGSNNLRPFLSGMSKNIGDEAYQKNAKRLLKSIIGTRSGLQAAVEQGKNDPDFQEQMQIILKQAQEPGASE